MFKKMCSQRNRCELETAISAHMRLIVYGRQVEIERTKSGWATFYLSGDGKRRPAEDIRVTPHIPAEGALTHIADLCHEWASPEHHEVVLMAEADPS